VTQRAHTQAAVTTTTGKQAETIFMHKLFSETEEWPCTSTICCTATHDSLVNDTVSDGGSRLQNYPISKSVTLDSYTTWELRIEPLRNCTHATEGAATMYHEETASLQAVNQTGIDQTTSSSRQPTPVPGLIFCGRGQRCGARFQVELRAGGLSFGGFRL
jgi:hypothetical protein